MRGFSLTELVLSCALLAILTALVTFAWVRGARTWVVATRVASRSNQISLLMRGLERELLQTQGTAVTVEGTSLAFPSPYGVRGQVGQDVYHRQLNSTEPLWSKYQIYSHHLANQTVTLVEVAIAPASPQALTATPLTGLAAYVAPSRVLAQQVTLCQFQRQGPALVLQLEWEEQGEGSHRRHYQTSSSTVMRN